MLYISVFCLLNWCMCFILVCCVVPLLVRVMCTGVFCVLHAISTQNTPMPVTGYDRVVLLQFLAASKICLLTTMGNWGRRDSLYPSVIVGFVRRQGEDLVSEEGKLLVS